MTENWQDSKHILGFEEHYRGGSSEILLSGELQMLCSAVYLESSWGDRSDTHIVLEDSKITQESLQISENSCEVCLILFSLYLLLTYSYYILSLSYLNTDLYNFVIWGSLGFGVMEAPVYQEFNVHGRHLWWRPWDQGKGITAEWDVGHVCQKHCWGCLPLSLPGWSQRSSKY